MAVIEAVIDVGTNTVLLLVARLDDSVILNLAEESSTTRLGQGLQQSGALSENAIERTLTAVHNFLRIASDFGVRTTYIVATSAVRDAKNREMFEKRARQFPNSSYTTLSGEDEARYTYLGACSNPEWRNRKLRVVDVGGGSTELISGEGATITDVRSVDIGHVRLTESFSISDPISDSKIRELMNYVKKKMRSEHLSAARKNEMLLGVGGTFTALAQIDMGLDEYDAERIQGFRMTRDVISSLREKLQKLELPDRTRISGLSPTRADVIVAGTAIIESMMRELRFDEVTVSTRGLRHGVLVQTKQNGE